MSIAEMMKQMADEAVKLGYANIEYRCDQYDGEDCHQIVDAVTEDCYAISDKLIREIGNDICFTSGSEAGPEMHVNIKHNRADDLTRAMIGCMSGQF